MSDSNPQGAGCAEVAAPSRRDPELRTRFERRRALNSAWDVLAPFGLSAQGRHIVDTGRAVGEALADLASKPPSLREPDAFVSLDKLLDPLEQEMRSLAFEVPVAQLRSLLPARLPAERGGVVDLLDLMLGEAFESDEGLAGRISAVDYLITLLCTGGPEGDRSVAQDPVSLTPRLHALCERAAEHEDAAHSEIAAEHEDAAHSEIAAGHEDVALSEIAAEFHAAANVNDENAREEVQLRALRRRKRELGARFFVPSVLRAVVAYNAALTRCIERGVWDSRDWGWVSEDARAGFEEVSALETQALPRLVEALRRRSEGAPPTSSAIDRVAWCLDLDGLQEAERAALLSPETGRAEGVLGTTILIGLLMRSLTLLEGELPAIGISPGRLCTEWVTELDERMKREGNALLAANRYEEACVLSELRTRFLYAPVSDVHAPRARQPRPAGPDARGLGEVAEEARSLASEALERERPTTSDPRAAGRAARSGPRRSDAAGRPSLPSSRLARVLTGAACVGLFAWGLTWLALPGGDLMRIGGTELEAVSPYLSKGVRNGEGAGPAFVGTLDESWSTLAADGQADAAEALVESLRAQGVREVMVYDAERQLRIQALGAQPVRVLPARAD